MQTIANKTTKVLVNINGLSNVESMFRGVFSDPKNLFVAARHQPEFNTTFVYYVNEDTLYEAFDGGSLGYSGKPFNKEDLRSQVRAGLWAPHSVLLSNLLRNRVRTKPVTKSTHGLLATEGQKEATLTAGT